MMLTMLNLISALSKTTFVIMIIGRMEVSISIKKWGNSAK